jgi:HK97 family phage prohead protease
MTEVQAEVFLDGDQVERQMLVRTFAVTEQAVDGRTLEVRVVPFDEVATVADPPDFRQYREQFMPGVFDRNEPNAHRIRLRSDHDALDATGQRKPGLAGVVGKGVHLREDNLGYEAAFRFLNTPEADTALDLVSDGGYDGVSAEFVPIRSVRAKDGVMQRVKAHLDSVALALGPAYSKAEILALREGGLIEDEEMLPPPVDKEFLERCAKLGIALPARMETLLGREFTEVAWDGSESRWATAEEYCSATAIDLNPDGQPKVKSRCHLPYKEPGSGTVNVNGVRAALARIGQGFPQDATPAQRDAAKADLEKLLNSFTSSSS